MRGVNSRPRTAKPIVDIPRKSSLAPIAAPQKTALQHTASFKPVNLLDLRNDDVIVRPKTMGGRPKTSIMSMDEFLKRSRKLAKESETKAKETPSVAEASNLENKVTNPKEWIVNFVRSKLSNNAATLIQRTWRSYKIRKSWGGIFNQRIWSRHDILLRIFLGWRGYATKNFDVQVQSYNRFSALHQEKPWISIKTNLAPFNMFYATGRWFYPKLFNARTFLYVYRVFSRPEGRHILQLWRIMASSIRGYRENSHKFIHTIHKRQAFGPAFIAFTMWNRFIQWKKENKERPDCFSLQVKERLINWDIVEGRLNKRKAQRIMADQHHTNVVRKHAYMAIHQHLVERRQLALDMESAVTFFNHHVMEQARRAWLKYDTMKRQKRVELLKMQRAWYTMVFERASKNQIISSMTTFRNNLLCSYCFTMWRKNIRYTSLRLLKGAYMMFRKPSPFRQLFFAMLNQVSFVFFERSFHEWVMYWRRRKAWKKFQQVFKHVDDNREMKQLCFYGLKKASETNLVRRLVHTTNRFFPNQTYYSVEGMQKNMMLYFDPGNPFKYQNDSFPQKSDCEVLIRSFLLVLDQKHKFDRCKFSSQIKEVRMTPRFGYFNYSDIKKNFKDNTDILRKCLSTRLARDRTTLTGVDSHHMALKLAQVLPGFTPSQSDSSNALVVTGLNAAIPLNIPEDIELSIDHLIEEAENMKFVVPQKVSQNFKGMRKIFDEKLRHPNIIYGNKDDYQTPEVSAVQNPTNIPLSTSKKQGQSVTSFTKPVVDSIPFDSPSLPFVLDISSSRNDSQMKFTTTMEMFETFNSQSMRNSLEKADPYFALKRFFFQVSGIRIEPKTLNEINLDVDPSVKRIFRRNVNSFVSGLMGIKLQGKGVPISIDKPDWVTKYVNAAVSVHNELSKFPTLFSFCAQIPFSTMLILDDDESIEMRNFMYNAIVLKFPKLQKKNNEGLRRAAADSDEMKRSDLNASLILLPYILRPELIKDFIKEEIK